MDVVAIKSRENKVGIRRIPHHSIKIDHPIEWRIPSDPVVHFIADTGLLWGPTRVAFTWRTIMSGDDRRTVNAQSSSTQPGDAGRHPRGHLPRRGFPTNVVRSHEQDDIGHAVM